MAASTKETATTLCQAAFGNLSDGQSVGTFSSSGTVSISRTSNAWWRPTGSAAPARASGQAGRCLRGVAGAWPSSDVAPAAGPTVPPDVGVPRRAVTFAMDLWDMFETSQGSRRGADATPRHCHHI